LQTSEIIDDDFNQNLILYDTYRSQVKRYKGLQDEIKLPIVKSLEAFKTKKGFTKDFTFLLRLKRRKKAYLKH